MNLKLNENLWDLKDIDPYNEEYWDEEKYLNVNNYFEYDNIEYGKNFYPIDKPVLLKPGSPKPNNTEYYSLGFIYNINTSYEPSYSVVWYNTGLITNHYTYDLLYNKEFKPLDWDLNDNSIFTMDDNILYEISISSENNENILIIIKKLNVIYTRRTININTLDYYTTNIKNVTCFSNFIKNKKFGYLQDCSHKTNRYNKNILYFTNKFDPSKQNLSEFSKLIKRRMTYFELKITKAIEKLDTSILNSNDAINKFKNAQVGLRQNLNAFDYDNINNIEDWFYIPFSKRWLNVNIQNCKVVNNIIMTKYYNIPMINNVKNYFIGTYPDGYYLLLNKNISLKLRNDIFDEFVDVIINRYIQNTIAILNKNNNDDLIQKDKLIKNKEKLNKQKKDLNLINTIKDYLN